MNPLDLLYTALTIAGIIFIACLTLVVIASTIRTIRSYFNTPPPAPGTTPILKGGE